MAAKRKQETTHAPERESSARTNGTGAASETASPILMGRLLTGSTPTSLLVDFGGNPGGPLRARTTVTLDAAALDRAIVTNQQVTLVFENVDLRLPIVIGLVQAAQAATPFQELLVSARPGATAAAPVKGKVEARLDGERVVLEGRKEVVIKCGEASITLRRDGKMVLRGAYVETYSKGLNRIKGASVKIN